MQKMRLFLLCALFLLLTFFVFRRAEAAQVNIANFLDKGKKTVWTTSPADFQKNNGSKAIYNVISQIIPL